MLAVVIFFVFASLFWGAYEQAGSTLNLFADRFTRLTLFGQQPPPSASRRPDQVWMAPLPTSVAHDDVQPALDKTEISITVLGPNVQ